MRSLSLNTFQLRLMAIIFMFIDHYGAVIHPTEMSYRIVGRLAFPIFAYLLANGYRHTRNKWKYLIRLSFCALLSEVPFDLTFGQSYGLNWDHQNIFFTLALGLTALMVYDKTRLQSSDVLVRDSQMIKEEKKLSLLGLILVLAIGFLADLINTDYGMIGVVSIFIFYLLDQKQINIILTAALLFVVYFSSYLQLYAIFALLIISCYNDQPGPSNFFLKWFFYLFYPLHLLFLHLCEKLW